MSLTVLSLDDGRRIILRQATNADGEAARALVFTVLAEYGLKGEPDVTDACMRDLEASYTRAGGLFNVLLEDGVLVGCYGIMPHGDGRCELRKMYYARSIRGRGLGKLLMARAIEEARALGFRRMELDTAASLKEAVALYRRFGFREFDNPGMPARCDMAMALEL